MAYGRQGATGDVRAYRYGVGKLAIHQHGAVNLDLAIDQMRRRVALWNRLVEIDREIRSAQAPVLEAHRGEDGRLNLTPEARQRLMEIENGFREQVNAACRESGCFWTNSQEVKIAWQAARRKPGDLRFHRWDGTGQAGLVLPAPVPCADLWREDGRYVRLRRRGMRPTDAWLDVRLGSAGSQGRTPVFVSLPITLHRPLPEDSVVRRVGIIRELLGPDERWSAIVTIERPAGAWRTTSGHAGRIAIDIGWRDRGDAGVRAAAWVDSAGRSGEVLVPPAVIADLTKVSDLQEIRDRLWNNTIALLRAWISANDVPDWLREETQGIAQWKRKGRLVRLWQQWRENRFAGDEPGFTLLDDGRRWRDNQGWVPRDHHLRLWQDHLRDEALGQRRDIYRVFAAHVAGTYAEVVLEDFDLRRVAQVKTSDGEKTGGADLPLAARRMRQWIAPSTLRMAILSACAREGVTVTVRDAAYTTDTCAACGHRQEVGPALTWRCAACGREHDQDLNAARVLLAAAD